MNDKEKQALQESVDTLRDENERLRKKIEALEAEKEIRDHEVTNTLEDRVGILEQILLKEPSAKGYRIYLKDSDCLEPEDDSAYRPERDDVDWSYRPLKGTSDNKSYSKSKKYFVNPLPDDYPYAPEVGDWPPGPQIGDVPPYYPPYGPYWSIFPPYWPYPYYWPHHNDGSTTGENPKNNYTYTFSNKTEE